MREAYISLGFKPDKLLYTRMEAAKVRVLRTRSLEKRRQRHVMRAMDAAERQLRLEGLRNRHRANSQTERVLNLEA